MIKIKELEKYYGEDFDELLKENKIVYIADDKIGAFDNYRKWELSYCYDDIDKMERKMYLANIRDNFYKWVENCNADELLNYDLDTYERHFMLENGKIYYLNEYI